MSSHWSFEEFAHKPVENAVHFEDEFLGDSRQNGHKIFVRLEQMDPALTNNTVNTGPASIVSEKRARKTHRERERDKERWMTTFAYQ